jgi:regulator of sigma E protease
MDGLIMAAQIITALAILVTLHELGHFLAARMFGIKVEKFYLFFDAWNIKLFKFKKGDTEYGIGWLPLGGYVKIAGMVDESLDAEQLKKAPEPWEFRSKPAWQRLIVMLGGIIVNLILGFIIFILHTWYYGEAKLPMDKIQTGIHAQEVGYEIGLRDGDFITGVNGKKVTYFEDLKAPSVFLDGGNYYDVVRNGENLKIEIPSDIIDKISEKKNSLFDLVMPCDVDSVLSGLSADKAGIKKGDKIIELNDTSVAYFHQLAERLPFYVNQTIPLKVLRNQDTVELTASLDETAKLGFMKNDIYMSSYEIFNYGFASSIPVGINRAYQSLADNVKGLKKLVTGKLDPRKSIQSPIGIATMFGAQWVWARFWILTGLLSLVLAIMNLLPIPALDGGHVVFLLVEMIKGKPLSDKFMQVMQVIGMVLLLSLMAFAFGNDLFKIFFK